MTDDPDRPGKPGAGDLEAPFLFVPHGAPEPAEWMRRHPGWVRFPATFVPHASAAPRMVPGTNRPWPLDKRGQPWSRSRFGQPLRPLDEYPPGVRAPGEGYTGPIADPARAVASYREFMAQGGMGTYDLDPDAPAKAYLRSRGVLGSSGQDAGDPPRETQTATAKPAAKLLPSTVPPPKTPLTGADPEAIQTAAPLAAALGAAAAVAALLGGTLGTGLPSRAKRPGAGGRSAVPPLAPPPGFGALPPPTAVEGYDSGSAGALKLPTPASPAGSHIESGPAADAEQAPHISPMARPKASSEETERRRDVIAGKKLPTEGSVPYVPPRHWASSQPLPRGTQGGYMDADCNERVAPRGKLFGERHWDVQLAGGGHLNVTKG